jgi:anti-sigma factor RsiW
MNVISFNQCEKFRRVFDAYLDNELLVETNQEILRHLSGCPECQQILNDRARLKQAVQRVVAAEPVPSELTARIHDKIADRQGWFGWTLPQWALAAAFAIIVAASVVVLRTNLFIPAGSPTVQQLMHIGLIDHVRCALMLENWKHFLSLEDMSHATGSSALGPDFLPLVPLVQDKIGSGFQLVQGHRCVVENREYIHLILTGDRGTILSLVITRKDDALFFDRAHIAATLKASGIPVFQDQEDQLQIAAFETSRYMAFLVSNLDNIGSTKVATQLVPPVYDFLHNRE